MAFAGHGAYCLRVMAWLKGEAEKPNPTDFHSKEELTMQCAVVIDQARQVWNLGNDLFWQPMMETKYAHGAGQEIAWGALEAGADAIRAIEIAMKRTDWAALGVDFVRFDGGQTS